MVSCSTTGDETTLGAGLTTSTVGSEAFTDSTTGDTAVSTGEVAFTTCAGTVSFTTSTVGVLVPLTISVGV